MAADCDCNIGTMIANALGLPHTLAPPSTPLESWTSSSFQQLISNLFLHSKDAYNNAITTNITSQHLANLIHEHQLEQTTEATAIEIDKEPIIDSATINSLIAQQVKEATKHLCCELANAQSQEKNKTRGANKKESKHNLTKPLEHAKDTTQAAKIAQTSHNQTAPSQQRSRALLKNKSSTPTQSTQPVSDSKKSQGQQVGAHVKDSAQNQTGHGKASSSKKGRPSHGRLLSQTRK